MRFVSERKGAGWSYVGLPKDPVNKTSPTLLAWERLPEAERAKTRAIVKGYPALLARAGFQIMRAATGEDTTQ